MEACLAYLSTLFTCILSIREKLSFGSEYRPRLECECRPVKEIPPSAAPCGHPGNEECLRSESGLKRPASRGLSKDDGVGGCRRSLGAKTPTEVCIADHIGGNGEK